MAYIDTEHLFKCETCRCYRNGKCNTFCDAGESYSPSLTKIPAADVVPRDEVAKIFEEIELELVAALESNYKWIREHNVIGNTVSGSVMQRVYGKIDALRGIEGFIEELKEKYTKGGKQNERT